MKNSDTELTDEEKLKRFADLVAKMRGAQTLYFQTRDKYYLENAKVLENEVDTYLRNRRQPDMF